MKTREDAQSLADAMAAVAELAGVKFTAQLNPMNEPLGHAVGNALEVLDVRGNLAKGEGRRTWKI